jgi:leucine dehydrogenase
MARAAAVYDSVARVIEISNRDNIPTYKAADRMAEERIAKIAKINNIYR